MSKTTTLTCITLFVHFFSVTARLWRENTQFHVLQRKYTSDDDISSLFLNLNMVLRNSTFRRVHLYLTRLVTWRNRYEDWKNANSLFQRPVFAASPSSDLKVPNMPKSTPPQSIKAQRRGIRAGFVKWLLLVMCWEFHAQLRVLNFQWNTTKHFPPKGKKALFFRINQKKSKHAFCKKLKIREHYVRKCGFVEHLFHSRFRSFDWKATSCFG